MDPYAYLTAAAEIRALLLALPDEQRKRALSRADICERCGRDLRELPAEMRPGHCE
jgi:hypothetical protein